MDFAHVNGNLVTLSDRDSMTVLVFPVGWFSDYSPDYVAQSRATDLLTEWLQEGLPDYEVWSDENHGALVLSLELRS